MKLKASDERDNEDLKNIEEFTVENWDKTLMVTLKLKNGNVIKELIDNLGKQAIAEDYWFGFDYDGYAFNGELFYVDDDPDSDNIAINIYTTVETQIERQKLMFRVKARIDPALLRKYIEYVKTGLPGVAWVKIDPDAKWPSFLQLLSERKGKPVEGIPAEAGVAAPAKAAK